ncbi:MAG: YfhL family 4Fe-4S dicluster ferredoxin [Dehalococcoidales bacterium]|nr:YfhL family 4Fe-4S dicluster ferredoxin [Dehalococcoidales bacterium]
MAYKITDDCISCGACEPECPNQAISEGETIYVIDPNKCTQCVGSFESSRCTETCPVDACVPDPAHKETREQLLAKWKKLHPGETPAVT